MALLDPAAERYMSELAATDDHPVLLEMEELAEKEDFPIIGRLCGRVLELVARAVAARRIFELGSGFGYSAYWFSRATGSDGEIHLTDMDAGNRDKALDFLGRAELSKPIQYRVGDALATLDETPGDFDIVYCDIDKEGYLDAWEKGRKRVRVGGLYICDNMFWFGRVAAADDEAPDEQTKAIDATNRAIASDPDWRSSIVPIRDGVVVALRLR